MSKKKQETKKPNPMTTIKNVRDLLQALKDRENHYLVECSMSRLYNRIMQLGVDKERSETIQRIYGEPELTAYKAFRGARGIERVLSKVVKEFIAPAASGTEQAKKLLVLLGPPGTWKSQLGKAFKRIYTGCKPVPYMANCQVHDNPLNVLHELATIANERCKQNPDQAPELLVAMLNSLGVAEIIKPSRPDVALLLEENGLDFTDMNQDEMVEALADLAINQGGSESLANIIIMSLGLTRGSIGKIGPTCPFCRDVLLGQFINPSKPVEPGDFPLEWVRFDSDYAGTNCIVSVPETDKNNFDPRTWFGNKDMMKFGRLPAKDPRNVVLNGKFDLGNRGIIELIEFLKNSADSRRVLLESTQSSIIPAPDPLSAMIHLDSFVFGHSNMKDWKDLASDEANAPYIDRFSVFWFGYPLELSEVTKIERDMYLRSDYGKPVEEGGVSVEPTIFVLAAALRILSALKKDPKVSMLDKLLIYNGDELRDPEKEAQARKQVGTKRNTEMGTKLTAAELRKNEAAKGEGIDQGLSPRFTADFLGALAGRAKEAGKEYVSSAQWQYDIISWIEDRVEDAEQRKLLRRYVTNEVDTLRRRSVSKAVIGAAIPSLKDQCQDTFDKYLDNVEAYLDPSSSGVLYRNSRGDETFMKEIEGDPIFGVDPTEAPTFRATLMLAIANYRKQNKNADVVPYDMNRTIKSCIENYILRKVLPSVRFLSVRGSRTDDQKKTVSDILSRLVDRGFHPDAAQDLLEEASRTDGFVTLE